MQNCWKLALTDLRGHDGVMIDSDDEGLDRLHHMDSTGPLLTTQNLVVPGEIHVLLPSDGDASHGQHVQLPEVGGDGLELGRGGSEPGRSGPGVPVMAANDSLRVETLHWEGGRGGRWAHTWDTILVARS